MRLASRAALLSSALSTLPLLSEAVSYDCKKVLANDVKWNIQALSGTHNVSNSVETDIGTIKDIDFMFDLCKPINHEVPGCRHGSRVCAFEYLSDKEKKKEPELVDTWSIAGQFELLGDGKSWDPVISRLKTSEANADKNTEGLRIEMKGGTKKDTNIPQKMVIELICSKESGLDGVNNGDQQVDDMTARWERSDENEHDEVTEEEDDEKSPDDDDEDSGSPLQFISYAPQPGKGSDSKKTFDVLRIRWRTKYACEDQADKQEDTPGQSSSGWGFFTWFIIILFLLIASYLIFGSWLNYTRHGARGWDLMPHGDTVRDIPYLLRDWGRKVVGTVSGGSRRDLGYIRV